MRNFSLKQKALLTFGIAALSTALLAGCNVFSIVDKPSGDEQILSKARACFDQADYDCAREYYAQLSSSYADVRASEEAFMILAENGATMADFMETFGSGGSGQALGNLAERLAAGNRTKRLQVYTAYKKANEITGSPSLKNLVRFVGATALASSILAEELVTGEKLLPAAIVATPSACNTTSACDATPDNNPACGLPSGAVILNTNTSFLLQPNGASDANFNAASPNIGMLSAAIQEMKSALTDLGAGSSFSDGAGDFSDEFTAAVLNEPECFRATLIELGVGN